MPSAGHYSDMQTLMQNMEVLAGWLKQNREEWGVVQEGLAKVEEMNHSQSLPLPLPLPVPERQSLPGDNTTQCMIHYSSFRHYSSLHHYSSIRCFHHLINFFHVTF